MRNTFIRGLFSLSAIATFVLVSACSGGMPDLEEHGYFDAEDAPLYAFYKLANTNEVDDKANQYTKWRQSEYINDLLAVSDQDAVDIVYAGLKGWPKVQARFEARAAPYKEAFMKDYEAGMAAWGDYKRLADGDDKPFHFDFPMTHGFYNKFVGAAWEEPKYVGFSKFKWADYKGYKPKHFVPNNHPKLISRVLDLAAQSGAETDCEIGWAFSTPSREIIGVINEAGNMPFYGYKKYYHPLGEYEHDLRFEEGGELTSVNWIGAKYHEPGPYSADKIWDARTIYYQFPVRKMFDRLESSMLYEAKQSRKKLDKLTLEALKTEVIYVALTYGRFGDDWVPMNIRAYTEDGDWEGYKRPPALTPQQALKNSEMARPEHNKPTRPCRYDTENYTQIPGQPKLGKYRLAPEPYRHSVAVISASFSDAAVGDWDEGEWGKAEDKVREKAGGQWRSGKSIEAHKRIPLRFFNIYAPQEFIRPEFYRPLVVSDGMTTGGSVQQFLKLKSTGHSPAIEEFMGFPTRSLSQVIVIANPAPIGKVSAKTATQ